MATEHERDQAIKEAHNLAASTAYFEPRRDHRITGANAFDAGFSRGWDAGRAPLLERIAALEYELELRRDLHKTANAMIGERDIRIAALEAQVEQSEKVAYCHARDAKEPTLKEAQVEQAAQPVHYRALLAEDQRSHQLKTAMHVVGFRTWKAADEFVASERDMNGWRYTIEPLYVLPKKAYKPAANPSTDSIVQAAVIRALDEANVRNDVLRGMCIDVALEKARDMLEGLK